MPTKEEITVQIASVGDSIRTLKEAKSPSDQILAKVAELKALKATYKEVTGEDFDPPPLSKKEQKELTKKKKADAAAAAAAAASDGGAKKDGGDDDKEEGGDGPSKNELKKLAKAAKKDAKRAGYKEGGGSTSSSSGGGAPCDADLTKKPPAATTATTAAAAAAAAASSSSSSSSSGATKSSSSSSKNKTTTTTTTTTTYAEGLVEAVLKLAGKKATDYPSTLVEPNAIARYLVSSSSSSSSSLHRSLLGATRVEQAEVVAWMSLAAKVDTEGPFLGAGFSEVVACQLPTVLLHDAKKTFLVGSTLTLADVALHVALKVAASSFSESSPEVASWASSVSASLAAFNSSSSSSSSSSSTFLVDGSQGGSFFACVGGAVLCPAGVTSVSLPRKRLARLNGSIPSSNGPAGPPAAVGAASASAPSGADPSVAVDPEKQAKQAAAKAAKDAKKAAKKEKKGSDGPAAGASAGASAGETDAAAAAAAAAAMVEACCKLDFRVGCITKAWEHPDSDKLWVEEIECGEKQPRQICSGLRAFYATADEVCPPGGQGRMVVIVANLKTKKLGGLPSEGMVLCASSPAHDVVKFVDPPPGAKPGDRVIFQGLPVIEPATPAQIMKKKVAEAVIFGGELTTTAATAAAASGDSSATFTTCTFKGVNAMVVEGVEGACTAPVPAGYMVA